MKWGLQQVKVTLEESESGETVVIEQSSDGRVTCERGKESKRERASNAAPQRAAAARVKTPAEAPAKPKPKREDDAPKAKADAKPRTNAGAEPRAEPDTKKPKPKGGAHKSHRSSLEWAPVKDHDYDGFAARSDAGVFKALITKGSQWALFYELKGTWPKNLGCFRKVEMAKKRAQELHDAGWPESEFGPVTAGQIARACPAPAGRAHEETKGTEATEETEETEEKEKPAAPKPAPKTDEKPTAPKSEAPPPSNTEPVQDAELMNSFNGELDATLDEDEDD